MEQVFEIEATLEGEIAELYAGLMEEFESKSEINLAEMNRALLQTGIVHHLTMMGGLGLIADDKRERFDKVIDSVASQTIMWDLVKYARAYWEDSSGTAGSIDLNA